MYDTENLPPYRCQCTVISARSELLLKLPEFVAGYARDGCKLIDRSSALGNDSITPAFSIGEYVFPNTVMR